MSTLTWEAADREALERWLELHVVARRLPADGASQALAEAALTHMVPLAAELPEDPPFVGVHHPTKPRAKTIEPWIEAVEAAANTPACGVLLANGTELGLLGVDRDIDRRAAEVIVDGFELETVQRATEPITRQALLDPLVGMIAEGLAETSSTTPAAAALRCAVPIPRPTRRSARSRPSSRRWRSCPSTCGRWSTATRAAGPARRGRC